MLSRAYAFLSLLLTIGLAVPATAHAGGEPLHADRGPLRVAPRAEPTPTCVPGGNPGAPGVPGVPGANGTAGVNGVPGTPGIRACGAAATATGTATATETAAGAGASGTATGPTPRASSSTIPSSDGPAPVREVGLGSSVLALLVVVAQAVL